MTETKWVKHRIFLTCTNETFLGELRPPRSDAKNAQPISQKDKLAIPFNVGKHFTDTQCETNILGRGVEIIFQIWNWMVIFDIMKRGDKSEKVILLKKKNFCVTYEFACNML